MLDRSLLTMRLAANNIYVVRGSAGTVLIDAGPDYEGSWEHLIGGLAAHGIRADDVRAVVVTHAHPDHAGLAARWQQAGARLYSGRADAEALTRTETQRDALRALAMEALRRNGVPREWVRMPARPHAPARRGQDEGEGEWPGPLRLTPVVPDELLDDGDGIAELGEGARVRLLPGHTPGTVVLWDEVSRYAFTGDHILPDMVATVGMQFTAGARTPSMPDFLHSLERTHALAEGPPWVAYPGHGDPLPDLAGAAAWSLRYLERRIERLRRRLTEEPATAFDLARRALPHLRPEHVRPVMAETLGMLDVLLERGEAAAGEDGDRIVFRSL